MMYDSRVEAHKDTPLVFAKEAKNIVKAIKRKVDGNGSAFDCMELETETLYQVTTYRDGVSTVHDCVLRRITPIQVEVKMQMYGTAYLEVSWIAEGLINGNSGMAKITAYATWEDDWYVWDDCADNGTPKAPYAQIYTKTL